MADEPDWGELRELPSKVVVKKNRVTITLRKVKGTYGYDQWLDLTAKRAKSEDKKDDPSAGIMDMMKDLYDNGDDNMRKIIGESMMKSRNGEKQDPSDIELPQSPSIDDDDATLFVSLFAARARR